MEDSGNENDGDSKGKHKDKNLLEEQNEYRKLQQSECNETNIPKEVGFKTNSVNVENICCQNCNNQNFPEANNENHDSINTTLVSLKNSEKLIHLGESKCEINISPNQIEKYIFHTTHTSINASNLSKEAPIKTCSNNSSSSNLTTFNNDYLFLLSSKDSVSESSYISSSNTNSKKYETIENLPSEEQSTDNVKVEGTGGCLRNYTRKQILTLICLCIADFATFLGMSIMAPFFPVESRNRGISDDVMGFVFSTYALVMFLLSPIFGYILPKVGANFLFLSGMFMAGGCTVLFGILDEVDDYNSFVSLCFIVRSFEAMGAAACCTASCTIVANVFPDNVGAIFGILETFVGFGMTVGPALGGTLYSIGGYKVPFLALGAFVMIMVPLNFFILPPSHASGIPMESGLVLKLLRIPKMIMVFLAVTTLASSWSFLDPFLEPHLSVFELSTDTVGLIFLMLSATYSIFSPIWGWVADRWEVSNLMIFCGMLFASGGLILLGPSPILPNVTNELWLNMVALIILGITVALALIPTFQLMMDVAVDNGFEDGIAMYSLVSGIWSAAYSLGDFVGPSVGGVLVKQIKFEGASSVIAGIITITALAFLLQEMCLRLRSKQFADLKESYDSGVGASLETPSEYTPLLLSSQEKHKKGSPDQIVVETCY